VKKAGTALISCDVSDPTRTIRTARPMHRIVFAFPTLQQHLRAVRSTPQSYRPDACGHCGSACLWCHGCYHRKADRNDDGSLNPVPVLRFRCSTCRRTCSRLPLCICPRRWYGWALQQQVLLLLLIGASLRRCGARPELLHRAALVALAANAWRHLRFPSAQPL
jgi:Domain of unknown function (DUF6431)